MIIKTIKPVTVVCHQPTFVKWKEKDLVVLNVALPFEDMMEILLEDDNDILGVLSSLNGTSDGIDFDRVYHCSPEGHFCVDVVGQTMSASSVLVTLKEMLELHNAIFYALAEQKNTL